MTDDLQVPPMRRSHPADLARQGNAMAELVRGLPPRSRLRRWLVSLGVGGVVVATAGAGIAYLTAEPAKDHSGVFCFSGPKPDIAHRGTSTNYDGTPAGAVGACTALWGAGILRLGTAGSVPPSTTVEPSAQRVPSLVACVYKSEAAVFPGDAGLCQRLGLPPLQQ